ncbi:MAG: hypothetical protein HFH64_14540 [Lachnospiraceae bacterium]|nr:hypothetical protein [Lachnospiraceae bacterium]
MKNDKTDIEELLEQGNTIQIHTQGYSMYPMFISGRDEAVIKQVVSADLKRGDVVLYRRKSGILVLHRIWKHKSDGFYMVGDNQTEIEGPLEDSQIKGVLLAFIRNGKYIETTQPFYRILSRFWLFLRPFRNPIMKTAAGIKKVVQKIRRKER